MANELPRCKNCKRELRLLHEDDSTWQFGCEPCKFAHVFSKPRSKQAAQARVRLERRAEADLRRRRLEAKPKHFLMPLKRLT